MTINVTDVNESPDISGNYCARAYRGIAFSSGGLRAQRSEGANIEWSLSGLDKGDFTITGGVLRFATTPDLENPTDHNEDNVYHVTVEVTDGEFDDELYVIVVVTDKNEIPEFPGATTSRDVSENTQPGQNVGSPVSATDPERDILTYSLGGQISHTSTSQHLLAKF